MSFGLLEVLEEKIKKLESDNLLLRKELDTYKDLEKNNDKFNKTIKELNSEIKKLNKELLTYKLGDNGIELKDSAEIRKDLRKLITYLRKKLEAAEETNKKLKEENNTYYNHFYTISKRLEDKEKLMSKLSNKNEKLSLELEKLKNRSEFTIKNLINTLKKNNIEIPTINY